MSDDNCMGILYTHDDDGTVDTDECYDIYEEYDLDEILYEIPVPKTRIHVQRKKIQKIRD